MRVAVYHSNRDVRIEDRPRPRVGPGEILLRIRASGICGSDVMEAYRRPRAPLILGHEVTGTVEESGPGVTGFRPGDRVFATHHVPCGECPRCQSGHPSTCEVLRSTHFDPGGFAEFTRVPALQVQRGMRLLPDEVSFDEGSFIEPLGCVVQAQRFVGVQSGQTVCVLGCGLSGLLHLQVARQRGASRIVATDRLPFRRQAALALGVDAAWDPADDIAARLREITGGHLAHRVLVCAGSAAAMLQGIRCVEPGGTVLLFAPLDPGASLPVPVFELWRDEITITTSYAASGPDLDQAIRLIQHRAVRVAEMITHRLPLERAAEGFALTAEPRDSLKVVLLPHG